LRMLAARRAGTLQSKWGRHCCRPHSHRYVAVFLQPKFKRRRLGIRCFPFRSVRRLPFRFCHRRSHRHPAPPSNQPGPVASRPKPFAYFPQLTFNRQLRSPTFRSWPEPRAVASPSGPKTLLRRLLRHPTGLARLVMERYASSSSTHLASGVSHRHEGLLSRADRFRYVFPVPNFLNLSDR